MIINTIITKIMFPINYMSANHPLFFVLIILSIGGIIFWRLPAEKKKELWEKLKSSP